jgi:tetratricopeptide (TPR) repeat protein
VLTEPRRGRGRPPQVPPAPREPIGRDRAAGSKGPRRAPRPSERPERPTFPEGAESDLPPRVRKEIDRLVHDRDRAKDVKLCLTLGTDAVEEEDHATAIRYLAWAKHLAPRSAIVREALAIALYRSGDLRAALSELQSYRRISGSDDQNHLLADCLRAEGRDLERAIEVGNALAEGSEHDVERRVEAAIVVAAVHLDLGRPARAANVIAPFLDGPLADEVPRTSTVRLLWVAADIAEADGSPPKALRAIERLLSLDPEYPDARERADRLHELREG